MMQNVWQIKTKKTVWKDLTRKFEERKGGDTLVSRDESGQMDVWH